jgi:hypothetical protein
MDQATVEYLVATPHSKVTMVPTTVEYLIAKSAMMMASGRLKSAMETLSSAQQSLSISVNQWTKESGSSTLPNVSKEPTIAMTSLQIQGWGGNEHHCYHLFCRCLIAFPNQDSSVAGSLYQSLILVCDVVHMQSKVKNAL